ncbi:hypothetical protein NPIL_263741 [Nephila pilipes]|uniref:Uncharacterized protein n=1 Tax=Nephila pilipes TaxID=299642 RepID=A0A8X6UG24_NEPPI|nr:hypothetical protein NPIL_263741 [Nephila pilipes]
MFLRLLELLRTDSASSAAAQTTVRSLCNLNGACLKRRLKAVSISSELTRVLSNRKATSRILSQLIDRTTSVSTDNAMTSATPWTVSAAIIVATSLHVAEEAEAPVEDPGAASLVLADESQFCGQHHDRHILMRSHREK